MITAIYLHDPPPLNGPFFMTPPFSASQKVETLPLFPHPSPLLISDKSLAYVEPTGSCFPNLICSRIVRVCNELSVHKYSKNFSSPCFNLRSKLFRTNEGEKAALLHSPFLLSPQLSRGNAHRQVTQASKSWLTILGKKDVFYFSVNPSKHVKKLYLIG